MIRITITGSLTGRKALLYEFPGKKGRLVLVPTYSAFVHCLPTGERFDFAATRDSSSRLFAGEPEDRYGEKGECPPCAGTPYTGEVREDGPVGFRIEFFEPGYSETRELVGQGTAKRRHMQIHFGAAASYGCILVAGPRRLYPRLFTKPLRAMLARTNAIQVLVEPRD